VRYVEQLFAQMVAVGVHADRERVESIVLREGISLRSPGLFT